MIDTWRWDEPEEKLYWCTLCEDCEWQSELEMDRDSLGCYACPMCGSENLIDEKVHA